MSVRFGSDKSYTALRGNTTVRAQKKLFFYNFFLGGRKGDREIILGIVIEHIFKYVTKNFCRKILQNGDTAAILPKHLEFEAICGTHYNWCEFEAGKMKNNLYNLHECS